MAESYQIRVRRDDQWVTVASFPILNARQLFAARPALNARYSAAGGAVDALKAVRGISSEIGAAAVDGTKIWVGFSFYEGEFYDGVGGVGFYDAATGKVGVWRPSVLRDCSVSSLTIADSVLYLATRSMRESGETACSGVVSLAFGNIESAPRDALKQVGLEEFMVENAAAEFRGMVSGFDGKTVPLQ